ncbi:hypothetical protein BGZ99_002143 [Dissophora globulifera]|uniref:Uncharacterized protein n=1 Tax=Dissophora globulifera TaxID=979702 RepID=A0A9P6UXR3_9FUNG|nr:hypothetical protein BGZ99_002143 [Dissophora globulifera]
MPGVVNIPAPPSSGTETVTPARDHDFAVISACHIVGDSAEERIKTLFIVDALKLRPFTLLDQLGFERFALAHMTVVDKLSIGQVAIHTTDLPQKKRKLEQGKDCPTCSPSTAPGLEQLLALSPYAATLLTRKFVELDTAMCELLNEDWTLQPQLQYACAQLLAGSIFFNTRKGDAVMNNVVEVYGRKKSVDAHRERFSAKKSVANKTSLPPATGTRYRDVWPLTLSDPDGERLVLGTHSFNALITSSIRLDCRDRVSVGGATSTFRLLDAQNSAATRIFLDVESVDAGLRMAGNRDVCFISARNKLDQLRQLRSKFNDGSTYRLCRASGFLTMRHTCNPYTVFTLADFDQAHSTDGQAAATLFQEVAKSVLAFGMEAALKRDAVTALRTSCLANGNVGKALDRVVACFPADHDTIPVIGNVALNSQLEQLAKVLSSYIATANSSVETFVQECFLDNA